MNKITEQAFDESGKLLWEGPYLFRRLFKKDQTQIVSGKTYHVISCVLKGTVVTTVIRQERE